jgi:hypothetical protein
MTSPTSPKTKPKTSGLLELISARYERRSLLKRLLPAIVNAVRRALWICRCAVSGPRLVVYVTLPRFPFAENEIAFRDGGDRGFESCFLQQGVTCEPDFLAFATAAACRAPDHAT